jgi:hypothetical protein
MSKSDNSGIEVGLSQNKNPWENFPKRVTKTKKAIGTNKQA